MGEKMATAQPPAPKRSPGFELARSIAIDLSILVGFGLLTYGSWLVYVPAAFIVPGVLLLGAGINGSRR